MLESKKGDNDDWEQSTTEFNLMIKHFLSLLLLRGRRKWIQCYNQQLWNNGQLWQSFQSQMTIAWPQFRTLKIAMALLSKSSWISKPLKTNQIWSLAQEIVHFISSQMCCLYRFCCAQAIMESSSTIEKYFYFYDHFMSPTNFSWLDDFSKVQICCMDDEIFENFKIHSCCCLHGSLFILHKHLTKKIPNLKAKKGLQSIL